ncbi:hypothetical protein DNTS_024849 [Danionella cerebrum]|uniref:Methyltransferase HEMK2 n=1 Tax=Danionella cerebrum TaxID=2873325 RepID=A0A553QS65_9TELE|nr:hypothetical protein DNTS_024849 [Danionella translucida]
MIQCKHTLSDSRAVSHSLFLLRHGRDSSGRDLLLLFLSLDLLWFALSDLAQSLSLTCECLCVSLPAASLKLFQTTLILFPTQKQTRTSPSAFTPSLVAVMYPTPLYAPAGRGSFSDVYEPAEDSFLLMDALEKDSDHLKQQRPCVCVEVGSGSGVVSAFLASIIGSETLYICTDVNPAAALCTLQTSQCNSLQLQPLVTDLVGNPPQSLETTCKLTSVQCLLPRLSGKVDVLVFNPPYVVTPSEEVGSGGIEASWAGGVGGREVMDRLFPVIPELLSNQGLFYLLTISDNHPDAIVSLLGESGLSGQVCLTRQAGRERLSVLKFGKPL